MDELDAAVDRLRADALYKTRRSSAMMNEDLRLLLKGYDEAYEKIKQLESEREFKKDPVDAMISPCDAIAPWEISKYDGNEHIAETHRTWY